MRIKLIECYRVLLPFRFAFKHSLASRSQSENVIVRVVLEDGCEGFGEAVPRQYVTGEDAAGAIERIQKQFAPALAGDDLPPAASIVEYVAGKFDSLGLGRNPWGAAWCALELAILDAVSRAENISAARLWPGSQAQAVRYGAVVPVAGISTVAAVLCFYRLYGFRTVKLKVGPDLEHGRRCLRLARQIMGPKAVLRVDANCAWTVEQAISAAGQFRRYGIASIEQPVAAGDLAGLRAVSAAIEEEVIADESLCTLEQGGRLAEMGACGGFNIRLSKVGGLVAARRMAALARQAGINCHLGAQVGESGILAGAGRLFASLEEPLANCEGSYNLLLLRQDLTVENLTVGPGGWARVGAGPGLGVTVIRERLGSPDEPASGPARIPEAGDHVIH